VALSPGRTVSLCGDPVLQENGAKLPENEAKQSGERALREAGGPSKLAGTPHTPVRGAKSQGPLYTGLSGGRLMWLSPCPGGKAVLVSSLTYGPSSAAVCYQRKALVLG